MRNFFAIAFACLSFYLGPCQTSIEKESTAPPTNNQSSSVEQRVGNITIPIDLSTRRPIVALLINGKGPYTFIFDTGSMTHVIDEKLYSELGFEVVGEDPLRTPGSDNKIVSKRVAVPKVGFPGTSLTKDVEMNVINLRFMLAVDGILSSVIFEDFLLTMDYPGSKLELTMGELKKGEKGVVSFLQKPRVVNLDIDVNGISVEAHLDTGSPGGISLPYSLKNQLTLIGEPRKGPTISTPVASFKRWDAELNGNITIGNIVFKNPKIALIEGFEYANLGFEVVKNLRTTFDSKNKLIRFEKQGIAVSELEIQQQKMTSLSASYSGTYEGNRKVWKTESGDWEYQREGSPISLKLVEIEDDLYKISVPEGVRAPMGVPNIQFIRNAEKLISGIYLVYDDGKREGPFKKIAP